MGNDPDRYHAGGGHLRLHPGSGQAGPSHPAVGLRNCHGHFHHRHRSVLLPPETGRGTSGESGLAPSGQSVPVHHHVLDRLWTGAMADDGRALRHRHQGICWIAGRNIQLAFGIRGDQDVCELERWPGNWRNLLAIRWSDCCGCDIRLFRRAGNQGQESQRDSAGAGWQPVDSTSYSRGKVKGQCPPEEPERQIAIRNPEGERRTGNHC